MQSGRRVLLLSLPYGALERPALGLSLLKAVLADASIGCDVRYLTFPYAELVGYDEYTWISSALPYTAFAGDWTFTANLYGPAPDGGRGYREEVLRDTWRLDASAIRRIERIAALTGPFLDHCLDVVPWSDYALVGFTSTFEQNIASLALASRVKTRYPQIATVFGGANWEGEMGCDLHRRFPFVDYVASGEAERSFAELCRIVLGGHVETDRLSTIRGLVFRREGESVTTGPPDRVVNLDELPEPDFSDYYDALESSTVGASVVPTMLFESSRGCWWGAKSHCTFCGLNGEAMAFRRKTSERALGELMRLAARWRPHIVEAVDNILDMSYFRDFLPALADAPHAFQLFYEVKANLTRRQIELLGEAGVTRIQPGIESLSDHVLSLMRKGTTALRNVQLLKWCRLYGVQPLWNLLYGFPGETREDYEDVLKLLPAIRFLEPPVAWGPVRLDRFSPYFRSPAAFGLLNVRPIAAYKHLYPGDESSLARIAYYFDYDYETDQNPSGHAADVIAWLEASKLRPETGTLRSVAVEDGRLQLVDSRSDAAAPTLLLAGMERALYEFCDEVRPLGAIVQHLRDRFPDEPPDESRISAFLHSLAERRVMVSDGRHHLSLALPDDARSTLAEATAPAVIPVRAWQSRAPAAPLERR